MGRRPIDTRPERITRAGSGGANVGVAIVPVYPPGVKNPLVIQQLMARPADVIHDFISAILLESFAHAGRDVVENFVPTHALPFSLASLSDTFQGITNPFGIGHLVQGCRPFSAVASSAAGMFRVAFESADAQRFFIDETKKTAGSFTVKTNGRDDLIVLLYFSRPM